MTNRLYCKISMAFVCIVLIVVFCLSFAVRKSFINDLEQRQYMNNNYPVEHHADLNGAYYSGDIREVSTLEEISDVIVRVSVNKEIPRNYNMEMTITNVDVLEIYKGNIATEDIYVAEPICYVNEGDFVGAMIGYYWMEEETEYILFLNRVQDVHLGEYDDIYINSTLMYSKYNTKEPNDLDTVPGGHYFYDELWKKVMAVYGSNNL
ncbi:MAG: hypothetical protein J6A25_06930 [Lachnospiraceae bacterium]|nr:hypothetical protein [Lachnospiraceae bacterium]